MASPSAKKSRAALPGPQWTAAPRVGGACRGLLASKVTLDRAAGLDPRDAFPTKMLLSAAAARGMPIGLLVDATGATARDAYWTEETEVLLKKENVAVVTVRGPPQGAVGKAAVPDEASVAMLVRVVERFQANAEKERREGEPMPHIAVLCDDALFNVAFFLVAAFVIESTGTAAAAALDEVALMTRAGLGGLFDADLRDALMERYEDGWTPAGAWYPRVPKWAMPAYAAARRDAEDNFRLLPRIELPKDTPYPADPVAFVERHGVAAVAPWELLLEDGRASLMKDQVAAASVVHQVRVMCGRQTPLPVTPAARPATDFPGRQALRCVDKHAVSKLAAAPYLVTWKAVGKRYLLAVRATPGSGDAAVFLVDSQLQVTALSKPMHLPGITADSLLDGELVVDYEGEKATLRFYIYDALAINGRSVRSDDQNKRLTAIDKFVIQPRKKEAGRSYAEEAFALRVKQYWPGAKAKFVLDTVVPNVAHASCGLVFVPLQASASVHTYTWIPAQLATIALAVDDAAPDKLLAMERNQLVVVASTDDGEPVDGAGGVDGIVEVRFDSSGAPLVFRPRADLLVPASVRGARQQYTDVARVVSHERIASAVPAFRPPPLPARAKT